MQDLPVSRIMSAPVITIGPGDTLAAASALLDEHGAHHLLVVERERMVGMLSSSDLLKLVLLLRPDCGDGPPALGDPLGIRVGDLMQSRVAVVRENASLEEVARALSIGGFHAVPVLAADDTPVGIVTSSDLVGLLLDKIERPVAASAAGHAAPAPPEAGVLPRLLEVLHAADVYLHSGQSDQQHARLLRAVARARELTESREHALGL